MEIMIKGEYVIGLVYVAEADLDSNTVESLIALKKTFQLLIYTPSLLHSLHFCN